MDKKKFLLLRFGGMGDAMFMTPVCRELHKRGYEVTVSTHERAAQVFINNPNVKEVIESNRWGPINNINGHPVNLVKQGDIYVPDIALYNDFPSERPLRNYNVADYFKSIENNTLHPAISATQSSNYENTFDLHLAWAGIDPSKVKDKSPDWFLTDRERKWGEHRREDWGPFIMLQPFASSPARSYTRVSPIMQKLKEMGKKVLLWHPGRNCWMLNKTPIPVTEGINPYRASGALIAQADLLISADTFVSHVAEALGTKHLTWYTTVPAWTRSKYYENEVTIDVEVEDDEGFPCKCCIIGRDCARIVKEAIQSLTKQEKDLISLLPPQVKQKIALRIDPVDIGRQTPWEYFGCASPHGFQQLQQAAVARYEALKQMEACCVKSLDLWPHIEKIIKAGE